MTGDRCTVAKTLGFTAALLFSLPCLAGCTATEEVEVEHSYNAVDEVGVTEANATMSNAAQWAFQCIRDKDYEGFCQIVDTEGYILTSEAVWKMLCSEHTVPADAVCYEVNTNLIRYGVKTGEVYAKVGESESDVYMGDSVAGGLSEFSVELKETDKGYCLDMTSFLDTEPVYVRVPDGVKVIIDGYEVDRGTRDKDNWYTLANFIKADPLKITLGTELMGDVEVQIPLSMVDSDYMGEDVQYVSTGRRVDFTAKSDYVYLDLTTREKAGVELKTCLQQIADSLLANEPLDKAACLVAFTEEANVGIMEVYYESLRKRIHKEQGYKGYSDIEINTVKLYDDNTLVDNGLLPNVLVGTNEGRLTCDITITAIEYNKKDGVIDTASAEHTSKVVKEVAVTFGVEEGKLKITSLPEEFFAKMINN